MDMDLAATPAYVPAYHPRLAQACAPSTLSHHPHASPRRIPPDVPGNGQEGREGQGGRVSPPGDHSRAAPLNSLRPSPPLPSSPQPFLHAWNLACISLIACSLLLAARCQPLAAAARCPPAARRTLLAAHAARRTLLAAHAARSVAPAISRAPQSPGHRAGNPPLNRVTLPPHPPPLIQQKADTTVTCKIENSPKVTAAKV